MTNVTSHIPAQHSALASSVASLFSVAILVMAGVVAFTAFLNV
ncbi:MAG TPA: hypothetical protein VGB91_12635 [Rhizomicrobium sp.]